MPNVLMLMGLPASGKSSFCKEISSSYIYLNRDTEGGKVASLVPKMVAAINNNSSVVLDNTFLTQEMRRPFIDACKTLNVDLKCVWFDTSFEDAQINACLRMINKFGKVLDNEEVKQVKQPNIFPIGALFAARNRMEPPSEDEGFSSIDKIEFKRKWPESFKNKALILDYDGTLRETGSGEKYPRSSKDVVVLKGRKQKLQKYVDEGYLLLGVSNQSGIGSGKVKEKDVVDCFEQTNKLLGHEIDYRYCPHKAGPGGCYCRKPQVGLGITLVTEYKLLPSSCIFVGDMTTDKTFATRCGFKFAHAKEFF